MIMQKKRTIIVATDMTPAANNAITKAATLAREIEADLIVAHVVDGSIFEKAFGSAVPQPTEAKLHALYGDIADAQWLILQGQPGREIANLAETRGADLIVVGDHAPSAVKDIFVGSTARKIIAQGKVPVLVVKTDAPIERVMLPTDFSKESFRCARFLFDLWPHKPVELLHVYPTPGDITTSFYGIDPGQIDELNAMHREKAAEAMELFLMDLGLPSRPASFIEGAVSCEQEILSQAKKRNVGLIAMGTQGIDHFDVVTTGSTADFILRTATTDVLLHRG
jgi:nucleotide-binding universal stress UspA family protein